MTVRTEGYGRSLLSRAALIYPGRIGKSALRLSTAAMLAGTLVLAGCGGGSDSADDTTMMPPPPTAFEAALAAINAATTVADAQAAYDDVDKEAVTGAEAAQLMDALNARQMALRAASQQSALMTLSAAVDTSSLTTQADVDAANAAIAALQAALDAADDVSDADKAQYIVQLNNARADVNRAVASIAEQGRVATQTAALMMAADAIDTSDLSTADAISAANLAIAGLQAALDNAVDVSDADKAAYVTQLSNARSAVSTAQANLDTMGRQASQRMTINSAVEDATTKVRAVNDDSTDAEVAAAETAIATLKMAIADAADLVGHPEVTIANGLLTGLESELEDATDSRQMAIDAAEEERRNQEAADAERRVAEMIALAAKLHAGISAPTGTAGSPAVGDRIAAYNSDDSAIEVSAGLPADAPAAVELSEDEDAVVDALRGWAGMSLTAEPTGDVGTYEAVVYSHVGEATEGDMFSTAHPYDTTSVDGTNTELAVDTTTAEVAARVAIPSFTLDAGTQTYELPANTVRVMFSGSYRGVGGTYNCTPTGGGTDCSISVAASGLTLGGGTWTFKATNPEQRLMDTPDTNYASYGWWLHKSEDDETYTASAFHDYRGTDPGTVGIATLRGTATYTGGAVGQYALHSTTGGANDAGDFTATATLKATFAEDHTISGTIDDFTGADGESRDWSVELKEATVADGGAIAGPATEGTVWTRGETAADASGTWSGALREQGDDGVPDIATGTFHSEYGRDGRMVGAFGANTE